MLKSILIIGYLIIGLFVTAAAIAIYVMFKEELIERVRWFSETPISDLSFILIVSYICISAVVLWPVVVAFVVSMIYDTTFPPKSENLEKGDEESE